MQNDFIHIGNSYYLAAQHIRSIVNPNTASVKRILKIMRENHAVTDATRGQKTRSVIFTAGPHAYRSSLAVEDISGLLLISKEKKWEE